MDVVQSMCMPMYGWSAYIYYAPDIQGNNSLCDENISGKNLNLV